MKHGKQVDVLIVGIGTDIVEIARVKRAAAREAFLMRVYTEAERAYCESRGVQRMASYAARFAGKEAVMKALGTGLRGGTLHIAWDRTQDLLYMTGPAAFVFDGTVTL